MLMTSVKEKLYKKRKDADGSLHSTFIESQDTFFVKIEKYRFELFDLIGLTE